MKKNVIVFALLASMPGYAAATKSYVDPSYARVKYSDIVKPAQPYKLKINVEFQRNGSHLPRADGILMQQVVRVLQASGFAVPAANGEPASGEISIIVNNIADLAEARRKGFATGSTIFLKGSTVTDNYEMQATATIAGKKFAKSGYQHAIHSIIGHAKGPEDLPSMTTDEAFAKIVEDIVLNFLGDLQKDQLASPSGVVPPLTPAVQVPASAAPTQAASLIVVSTPSGADIEIDGGFVGSTPSTISVVPGSHQIAIKKKGFISWTKTLNVTGGSIHLNAELEQAPAQ